MLSDSCGNPNCRSRQLVSKGKGSNPALAYGTMALFTENCFDELRYRFQCVSFGDFRTQATSPL
jgi:hypothetical protein